MSMVVKLRASNRASAEVGSLPNKLHTNLQSLFHLVDMSVLIVV